MLKTNLTLKNSLLKLCSRCIRNEIGSWVFDKQAELKPEIIQEVMSEIKSIKLVPGNCIACNSMAVSADSFDNILKIMEKNKVSEAVVKEFRKLFGFEI